MNDVAKMTDAEIKSAYAKMQADESKRKARSRAYLARPEVKAKAKEYMKQSAAKRKALLARAAELGLS